VKSEHGKLFRCKWFEEYIRESDRDQISFSYVLSLTALDIGQTLKKNQEWCPVAIDKNNQFINIRLLSTDYNYHRSDKIAIIKSHESYT